MRQACYRHPSRETGVSCSNCGKPICPECMTPTPVGMRCPDCAGERTKVVRSVGQADGFARAPATFVLIAINVVAYLIEIAGGSGGLSGANGRMVLDYGLYGPFVAEGEWYRLLTSGFLHASILHIGFNMLLLFLLGRLLEPSLGTARFLLLYFASLLAGSFGALLLSPNALTIGASGAIFGLAGATFVLARGRGMDAIAAEIGFLIVFNLVFSFTAERVSVGAHLGGLVAGIVCALLILAGVRGVLGSRRQPVEIAAMAAVGVLSIAGALAVA
jgi:membrane associated rhomboid family serine protease